MNEDMSEHQIEVHIQEAVAQVSDWFLSTGKTLCFAESCTGGLLSSYLTEKSGVSRFYLGTVVSYHGSVKREILGVPSEVMEEFGEVSEPVVVAMAQGACRAMGADWSVSISGVAGPGGGTAEKPVGTVCFAVVGPQFEKAITHQFNLNDRKHIQLNSVAKALGLLLDGIQH